MVTRTGFAGRLRFAAAIAGALAIGATAARVEASDLSATLSPQEGNGSLSYSGGASDLIGKNIGVESITGLNTPANGPSTSLQVVGGMLNFTTGAFSGGPNSTEWDFASGGNVTISGTIPSLGITTNTALLSGSFSDPTMVRSLNSSTDLKVLGGAFFSVVNPTLAQYFGLPTGGVLYSGGLTTLFRDAGSSPAAFSSSGFTGGTLTVSPNIPTVPEPGTLAVFACLTAAGGVWMRTRRN